MARDVGLLLLRLTAGGIMVFVHGWGKLAGFADKSASFPDPLGVGSAASLALAVFAEVFCALGLVTGTLTRLAVVPLVVTMLVAAGMVHAGDPWAKKELALVYLTLFATLGLTGPGRFSVDHLVDKWRSGRR
ncbi:MAG: DoxX family protein [Deltaproteobacteria bacterium]|nr:DoxX family protein [Deltaproteobacteria bacterium]